VQRDWVCCAGLADDAMKGLFHSYCQADSVNSFLMTGSHDAV
jgi:hypothetical protein